MDFFDRVESAPFRTVAIGAGVVIRFEDRLKHQLGSGLYHAVRYGRNPERPLALPPGFGIITRRTGAGRYVF